MSYQVKIREIGLPEQGDFFAIFRPREADDVSNESRPRSAIFEVSMAAGFESYMRPLNWQQMMPGEWIGRADYGGVLVDVAAATTEYIDDEEAI